jgi:segregation and condensation protein B
MDEPLPAEGGRPARSSKGRKSAATPPPPVEPARDEPQARQRVPTKPTQSVSEVTEPIETPELAEEEDEQLSLDALSAAYAGVQPKKTVPKPSSPPDQPTPTDSSAALSSQSTTGSKETTQRNRRGSVAAAKPEIDETSSDDSVEGEVPAVSDEENPTEGKDGEADEYGEVTPRGILEAMLFVGSPDNRPLTSRQIAALMRGFSPREIDDLIVELNAHYHDRGCPYEIASQGSGYVMQLRRTHEALRDRFLGRVRDAKLSQQAIDVLAIVAYRQPLEREEIEKIRAKPCGGVLSQLIRRQLLRIEQTSGRPRRTRYFTTDRFLEVMGLDSLSELPQSQDFDVNR